jgi:outer membrane lipoprotein-sorting protein
MIQLLITALVSMLLQPNTIPSEDASSILAKVDQNMASQSKKIKSKMVVHGRRGDREIVSLGYSQGSEKSFTEYLSPEREKGTKMLKLGDKLWIYSPSTDRTIQLSGHMLKQSVMGSDLSYEDMMEDRKLLDLYDAKLEGEDEVNSVLAWKMTLTAKVDDVAYYKREIWVDKDKYVPVKELLYAKSGVLLKKTEYSDVKKVSGKWIPHRVLFKDQLKKGGGTEFVILQMEIDPSIPEYLFTKASLKK